MSRPISAAIYTPAIPTLADAFGVTAEKINLTLTVYLYVLQRYKATMSRAHVASIFQALTPSFWGAASDSYGRR